jgi:hypothetical protein
MGQNGEVVLDRNRLLIGQNATLTYHIRLEKDQKIEFKPFQTFVPATKVESKNKRNESVELEITEAFIDTILEIKGKREWFGSYRITAWDSGFFKIPTVNFKINGKQNYFSEISIEFNLVKRIDGQDIYDIKESFTKLPPKKFSLKEFSTSYGWWLYPLLLIIVVLLTYFRWKKRKRNVDIDTVNNIITPLSLRDQTLVLIEILEEKKLWKDSLFKEHYVELSFILRDYLSKRFELNLFEKTTFESKLLLAQKGVNSKMIDSIGEILDQADMVKFAKSEPEEITIVRLSFLAKEIVDETSIVIENVN